MNPRKLAVIGAGPVGAILTAHLCSQGHPVFLVDSWKAHIEQIRSEGLRITGRENILVRPAHLYGSIEALAGVVPDFVFICTKACDLDNVLGAFREDLKSRAVFVSVQNGIDTEQVLGERIGLARVLRAVITYGGVLVGPGEIRETFFNPPNYLGWLDESGKDCCREIAELMSAAGLDNGGDAGNQKACLEKGDPEQLHDGAGGCDRHEHAGGHRLLANGAVG